MNSRQQAMSIAEAIEDAKGCDIVVLDVSEISGFADYFVIASGTSSRHVRSLADRTLETLDGLTPGHARVEGLETCRWVLVDAFDVVVHLFLDEARDFYGLERLWHEAERVERPERLARAL